MRILIHSRFYPSTGGIETISQLLANEWSKAGEEVRMASDVSSPSNPNVSFPYPVYYQPGAREWFKLLRWCDVHLQFNVSLKAVWPLAIFRRPLIASHHSYYWITRTGGRDWREKLKIRIASRASNIFASSAIAKEVGVQGRVIPNPYNDDLFRLDERTERDLDLVFVGRLVSDKGVDNLLHSLAILRKAGVTPSLSIIGDGPDRSLLEELAAALGVREQIQFLGQRSQKETSELLRRHQILVIPSLWAEPFGVVALEGQASGCVVIGSDLGGLPEAIGPCGLTFPNGNAAVLAEKIKQAVLDRTAAQKQLLNLDSHLGKHQPAFVAQRYLEVMRQALS